MPPRGKRAGTAQQPRAKQSKRAKKPSTSIEEDLEELMSEHVDTDTKAEVITTNEAAPNKCAPSKSRASKQTTSPPSCKAQQQTALTRWALPAADTCTKSGNDCADSSVVASPAAAAPKTGPEAGCKKQNPEAASKPECANDKPESAPAAAIFTEPEADCANAKPEKAPAAAAPTIGLELYCKKETPEAVSTTEPENCIEPQVDCADAKPEATVKMTGLESDCKTQNPEAASKPDCAYAKREVALAAATSTESEVDCADAKPEAAPAAVAPKTGPELDGKKEYPEAASKPKSANANPEAAPAADAIEPEPQVDRKHNSAKKPHAAPAPGSSTDGQAQQAIAETTAAAKQRQEQLIAAILRDMPKNFDPFQPQRLECQTMKLIMSRITPAEKETITWWLKRVEKQFSKSLNIDAICVGTACSGSDAIIFWFERFCKEVGVACEHCFSCEIDPDRRTYLTSEFGAKIMALFTDISTLAGSAGIDARTMKKVQILPVFLFFAGFVCKDASGLNVNAKTYRCASHMDKGLNKTGGTWRGCVAYLKKYCPLLSIFENVAALKYSKGEDDSMLAACMKDLRAMCLSTVVLQLNPLEYGFPEQRDRLYLLSSRLFTQEDMDRLVEIMGRFKTSQQVPLETYMMPEDHPYLQNVLESKLEAKRSKKSTLEPKFNEPSSSKKSKKGSKPNSPTEGLAIQDPALAAGLPWLDALTARERKQLEKSKGWGHSDCSQTTDFLSEAPEDHLNCITPHGHVWSHAKSRLVVGAEKAAVQGIFPSEHNLARLSDEFICELAGDAFQSPLVLLISISAFIVLSQKAKAQAQADAASADAASADAKATSPDAEEQHLSDDDLEDELHEVFENDCIADLGELLESS